MDRLFRSESAATAVQARRPCVMMVDDDADDRRIYGAVLCYNGYDVVMAHSIEDALLKAQLHGPDLVLLDIGLPDGDGLDACDALRRRSGDSDVPVIALSAFPQKRVGQRAIDAGCARFVEKPVSPVEVLHYIEELIGRAPLPGDGDPPAIIE